jgi:hypothetical protein
MSDARALVPLVLFLLSGAPALAQSDGMGDMPGMGAMPEMEMPSTGLLGGYPFTRDSSGTSWQPDAAMHRGLHAESGGWMLMGHLSLYGIYDTQSGPRGGDKAFVSGMLMGSARRDLANGDTLDLRAMLSPDPLMGRDGYPLLLASGETANGASPLIDRQHPHDLVMELSASYAHRLSEDASVFLYAGDPAEPALGPPAFMHRPSGMDFPLAPITHHWLDSTHVVFGAVTAGIVQGDWKFEVSRFTGREPDQNRFDFDPVRLDSTSARASFNPDPHWSLQASWGHLRSPEQLAPRLNEDRYTASAMYAAELDDGASVAATLAWGLKHLSDGTGLNGALLEGEYHPVELWTLFARTEWEQNDELDAAGRVRDVGELSVGALHDWRVSEHWKAGLGALYTLDLVPAHIAPSYGPDPHGALAFVRVVAE